MVWGVMTVTFYAESVDAEHWLTLAKENARAIIHASGLGRFDFGSVGQVKADTIPDILAQIETALASADELKPYAYNGNECTPTVCNEISSNVVRLNYSVRNPELTETYLRRKLARLYILLTAAVDINKAVRWG